MNLGCISREYYIGRYIYLTGMIAGLPDVRPGNKCGSEILSLYLSDQNTGRRIRRRISRASSLWDQYYEYALKRERLESQLKNLLTSWSEDYSGALSKEASKYKIIPPKKSYYNSAMWESFKSNDCDVPNDFPVFYKSFVMRSQFEVEVAKVLDSLGIDYKYEVRLPIGGGDEMNPDMSVNLPEYNRCGFVEALGGLDNMKYTSHNTWKLKNYINIGLYPNRDVALISADKRYFPDRELIKRSIGLMLSSIAAQYVVRVE